MTPNHPLPVSVCLIVKNEADRLEKTLAPFAGRVAEMLAYDNGSTDATIDILQKHGVTVIRGPWLGYAASRRAIWGRARQDWILWLDADEIFSPITLDALAQAFARHRADPQLPFPAGFRVRRQVVFQGRTLWHGDWDRDWVLRVFRRDNFTMADRLIHESVTVAGRVVKLPGIVEHHSFRTWADLEARRQTYAALWAKQALAQNRRGGSPALRALWAFVRGGLIRSGWLDGPLGVHIALHNAREVYQKYRLLNALRRAVPDPSRANHPTEPGA